MKPGLDIGQTAELELTVTPDMRAQFGGETVHNLLSTSVLVHYIEWVARKTIVPYLDSNEEGMGARVDISHLMMTPIGVHVRLKATVTAVRENKVECEVEAFNWRGKVARATVVQAIVQKPWLNNKIRELTLINDIVVEQQAAQRQGQTHQQALT